MVMKNFAVMEEEIGARAKKNISKGKKVLWNISNSSRNQTSSRKKKLTEEPFHEKEIPYEIDHHNHEACRKARECKARDMNDFLRTIGLKPIEIKTIGLANGCPKKLPFLKRPESPPPSPPPKLTLRLLERPEEPILDRKFDFAPLESPDYQFWKY